MKTSIANQSIHIDGMKLAYYQSNFEHEHTVVLIHGYCGSSAYFHSLIPLVEKYAAVIAFDLFGHGQSDALMNDKYNLDEVAILLNQALTQMNSNNVYLFGHSLGGYITLAYANQFNSQLKGYGLLHSTALPDSEEAKANRLNVIASVSENGVEAFTSVLVNKLYGEQPRAEDIDLAIKIGKATSVRGVIGFAHAMRERQDAKQIINSSPLPVLLIAGKQDKIVSPEAVFAGHNDQTVCKVIEEAGHMGMLEAENQVASLIQRFICN